MGKMLNIFNIYLLSLLNNRWASCFGQSWSFLVFCLFPFFLYYSSWSSGNKEHQEQIRNIKKLCNVPGYVYLNTLLFWLATDWMVGRMITGFSLIKPTWWHYAKGDAVYGQHCFHPIRGHYYKILKLQAMLNLHPGSLFTPIAWSVKRHQFLLANSVMSSH